MYITETLQTKMYSFLSLIFFEEKMRNFTQNLIINLLSKSPRKKSNRKIIPTEKARSNGENIKKNEVKTCNVCEISVSKSSWTVHQKACQRYEGFYFGFTLWGSFNNYVDKKGG